MPRWIWSGATVTRTPVTRIVSSLALCFAVGACSGGEDGSTGEPREGSEQNGVSPNGAVSGDAGVAAADSTSANSSPPVAPLDVPEVIVVEQTPAVDAGTLNECARDTYAAERVGVNLMLLVDISGSMLTPINENGETQWEAVGTALADFVNSSSAEGLSIALNYFPAMEPRYACEAGDACSDGYSCISSVCDLRLAVTGIPYPCLRDSDCSTFILEDGSLFEESCVQPFGCAGRATETCLTDTCQKDAVCDVSGPNVGFCPGLTSCDEADYASPAVELATLPEGRDALLESLDSVFIDVSAQTPTHLGVRGATAQIQEWQTNEPEKQSFLVLATDGLPTSCETPLETAEELTVGEIGAAFATGVQTFVIGVVPSLLGDPEFDAEIAAQKAVIDGYASTGGTGAASFVSADDSTAQAFLEALDAIRQTVLPCEFTLPDEDITFDQVNVEVTQDDSVSVLPKVAGPSACSAEPGWYYDSEADDSESDKPEAAVLCPSSCESINSGLSTQVDIILGCPTITPEAR